MKINLVMLFMSELQYLLFFFQSPVSTAKSLLFSTPTGIKPLQQVKSFPKKRLKKEASHDNTNLDEHCTKTEALLLQSADISCPTPTKMKMKSQQQMEQMFSKFLLSDVGKKQGEPLKSQQVARSSAPLHQKESDKRRKHEMCLHCLNHLYYFSLIKMALSKRLLKQSGQFSDIRKGQSVHDLMEYLFPNGHEQSRLKCNKMLIEENTAPCLIHAKQQEMHQKDFPKMLSIPKEKKKLLKQEKHNFYFAQQVEGEKSSAVGEKGIIAMPLSLEDVAFYHPVIEPKQIGKYWTNYTGKNSFNHEIY
ncbi:uncharacterized protein LOC113439297 isoform X1 [Pseudonaja textilis]|uniref:uncharacterized protein LOC113439297 isoform X1 n=1 Tax=Pseudonaja textilis TaxID=8673 RepID=UPI000EA93BE4|nr:uncharacterized protein LOC113439297 isoform X1 [Pseudonaja textilis]